jgi:hypothetical protein
VGIRSPSKLGAAEGAMVQRSVTVPGQAQAILSETKENMGPKAALEVVARARSTWLQNVEVVDLLRHHKEYNFHVNTEPPTRPPGMIFVYFGSFAYIVSCSSQTAVEDLWWHCEYSRALPR